MPEEKKSNKSNGLERCPVGTDVGPLGKSTEFVDSFVAGFIYATAIVELVEKTEEINIMLETMDEEEKQLLPTLNEEIADIDAKWILATAMFAIDA
ncbi:MAG: hypothetical protein VX294_04620 [Candidatus Latescibacterota bacterium]|nr:hypothetical protein [Candidatus Latescibacterota bacterium]